MLDVVAWLDGPRDYLEGLKLFKQYLPGKAVLLQVLGSGDTFYNRGRLVRELTDLLPDAPLAAPAASQKGQTPAKAPALPAPASSSTQKNKIAYGRLKLADYPPELHAAFGRQDELYRTVNHLHSQLELLHEIDQGRCTEACKVIVKCWREINSIYRILDYWTENRVILPNKYRPVDVPVLTDKVAMMKRMNALRVYISRNKNNLERSSEVAAWKVELEELKVRVESE
jgi:hypothetical protein